MTNDQLLQKFVETWPIERVRNMRLEEYNQQGSKDTFCFMLEYGTRQLGNISGHAFSSKFEIYERKDKNNIPKSKDYGYDSDYTWRNRAGVIKTKHEAFEYTRSIIVEVIEASKVGNFNAIDGKKLAPLVIWKIAFLYSDKKLLSISDRQAVRFLARLFGMKSYQKARISVLHEYLMQYVDRSRFWDDMHTFWSLYSNRNNTESSDENFEKFIDKKGVTIKNIEDSLYMRNIKEIIVSKSHNRLQQRIYNELVIEYGDSNVKMEKDNIDIQVEHDNCVDFYEVKIAQSAKYCIRQALGQIVEYAHNYKTSKRKKLIIVGNHPLTENDVKYVNYLKGLFIDMELEYQHKEYNSKKL